MQKYKQFIVAMSGSFDVVLDDGKQTKRYHLNRSYQRLYVCPMMWRYLEISLPEWFAWCLPHRIMMRLITSVTTQNFWRWPSAKHEHSISGFKGTTPRTPS